MGAVVGRFSGRRKPQQQQQQQQQPSANDSPTQTPVRPSPPPSAGGSNERQAPPKGQSYRAGRSLGPHRQLSALSLAQRGDTLQSKSLNRDAFGAILRQTQEEEEAKHAEGGGTWVRRRSIIDEKACAEHPFKLLDGGGKPWQISHWSLQEPPASAHAPAEGGKEVGVVRVRSMGGYCCGVSSVVPLGGGKGCAVSSLTGEVHLWSLADPPPRPHLLSGKPFRLPVAALDAVSQPHSLLAAAGYDHSLSIWEVLEGEEQRWRGQEVGQSVAHQSVISCVDFSPCAKLVATGGADKAVIRVWDAPAPSGSPGQHPLSERGMLVGHWSWVTAVKFSTDSKLLFSASLDSTIRVWDVECLEPTVSMGFHDHNAVQSRSSCYIPPLRNVTVKQLEQILVNDQAEQRFLLSHKALGQQVQLCKLYDADGWGRQTEARFQYVLCETGEILYTSSGWLRTLRAHTGPVNSVQIAPDSSLLASAGDDGAIILWDPQFSRNEELVLDDRFAEGTAGYHILSIEDEMIPAGPSDKSAMTIPVEGGDVKLRLKSRQSHYYCKAGGGPRPQNLQQCERPEAIGFVERMRNPCYQIVRDDGSEEVLFDWDCSKTKLRGHQGPVTAMVFTPDSTHILSSSDDGTVRTWSVATLACESVLHSPLSSFASLSVCWSPPLLLLADKAGAFHVLDQQSFDGKKFITGTNKDGATAGAAR